jgi:uncharacterized membrane protein
MRGTDPAPRDSVPRGSARRERAAREPATGRGRDLPRPLGWLPWTAFALCILGFADSGYQVYTHFADVGLLGCSARTDACGLVQNSVYGWIFGIPVAVYGVAFFAFMIAICWPPAWRSPLRLVHRARLGAVIIGMIFVLYLIYREVVSVGQVCPYCTSVHIITFALFALVVYADAAPRTPQQHDR